MTSTTDAYLPAGLPAPMASPDGLDTEFWAAARRHELVVQHCRACDTFLFGPEWLCHNCHSFDLAWDVIEPRGRIFSWQRCWHPVHPALAEAGPYLVVLVELPHAGGVRMVGNLLGDPHQDVVIGTDVVAVFEDHDDADFTLVQWRVAAAD